MGQKLRRAVAAVPFRSRRNSRAPPRLLRRVRAVATRSAEVAGVDVDAGHALAVEHLDVASIVLERQRRLESAGPQFCDGPLLEVPGGFVVAVVPHDQQIPAEVVPLEPGQGLALHPDRPCGEQHDMDPVVEVVEQGRHLVDERVLAAARRRTHPSPATAGPADAAVPPRRTGLRRDRTPRRRPARPSRHATASCRVSSATSRLSSTDGQPGVVHERASFGHRPLQGISGRAERAEQPVSPRAEVTRRIGHRCGHGHRAFLVDDPTSRVRAHDVGAHDHRSEQAAGDVGRVGPVDRLGRDVDVEVGFPQPCRDRITERRRVDRRPPSAESELAGRIGEDPTERHLAGVGRVDEAERVTHLVMRLHATGAAVLPRPRGRDRDRGRASRRGCRRRSSQAPPSTHGPHSPGSVTSIGWPHQLSAIDRRCSVSGRPR